MVDINLWRLEYGDTVVDFGTHDTSFPLTKQVEIGVLAAEYGDQPHPTSNGVVPGIDRTRGRVFRFAGAHLRKYDPFPDNIPRSRVVLDDAAVLESAWLAEQVAETDGAVATLTNLDRSRTVYGRPRNYGPGLEKIRAGWSTWVAEFHTVDGRTYGDERAVNVTTVAGHVGGFTAPFTTPLTTSTESSTRALVAAGGTLAAWPVITLTGGCLNPSVQLLDAGGGVLWEVSLEGSLPPEQDGVIDTRPWSRGVTVGGSPRDGWLRGQQLDLCRIPPGVVTEVRYAATADPGAVVAATVAWRDAFAGL